MKRSSSVFVASLVAAALAGAATGPACSEMLVKPDEAKRPAAKNTGGMQTRGVTRGPKIEFVPVADPQRSPFRLKVNFQSFGGSKVDVESVQVSYLKSPVVDLTDRVKPFLNAGGIDMPTAELPPGEHIIRIDLKDSEGRAGSANVVLKIAP